MVLVILAGVHNISSFTGHRYRYASDLMALDNCRPPRFFLPSPQFCSVVTPLKAERWEEALRSHPDKVFVSYITHGIRDGFRIGFRFGAVTCRSTLTNMPSAKQCEQKIDEFFATECAEGRILGPFDHSFLPAVHINRLGAVPKSTPGKYRMIVDLSFPEGHSPNDGIAGEICSLKYTSVEDAAQAVLRLGCGTFMAKMDIRSAYRNIPVHPDDRWLLGMTWKQGIFVDAVLPFGLRSAPKIFNTVADALEWVVRRDGVREVFHYLDDFLVLGHPNSAECGHNLAKLLQWSQWLGFPIAFEKVEGPLTRMTFLGIEIDADAMVLRLPQEKLLALTRQLTEWKGRRWCRKSELQSLAGCLQHACKVVRPGRTFLRRVFELLRGAQHSHHYVRLNKGMRSDLAWWELFLETWNGVSLLRPHRLSTPDYEVFTDASGSFGCGAVWEHTWLQLEWPVEYREVPIAPKELVPIVVACTVWGKDWSGKVVHVHSDNEAVVAVVNSGYSKDTQLMHLTRCLFFVLAAWDIALHASHIPGVLNTAADAVSRNNLSVFFSTVQGANPIPAEIPRGLGELLMTRQPDWTEESWRTLFRSCLSQVWHHPPRRPTGRGSAVTSVFVPQPRSLRSQPRNTACQGSLPISTSRVSVHQQ